MTLATILAQAPLPDETQVQNLTAAGWTVMLGCIGFVGCLCAFCFWHILKEGSPSEHHHAPLDIETNDN